MTFPALGLEPWLDSSGVDAEREGQQARRLAAGLRIQSVAVLFHESLPINLPSAINLVADDFPGSQPKVNIGDAQIRHASGFHDADRIRFRRHARILASEITGAIKPWVLLC